MIQEYLPQIIITLITLVATTVTRIIVRSLIRKYALLNPRIEQRTNHIIRIFSILINSTCALILIIIWGVDPRNLFLTLSSVFAVIGVAFFAQWSVLSNITAGIILFFSSPFKIGDYVKILDKDFPIEAKIEDIYTFYTYLRTRDGELHVFPNSLLLQKGISVLEDKEENL